MDIQLGSERIFALEVRVGEDDARQRAMDRRTNAFGGGIGSLLQRPKPDDVVARPPASSASSPSGTSSAGRVTSTSAARLRGHGEPPEVREVTILGETYPVAETGAAARTFTSRRSSTAARISFTRATPTASPATPIAGADTLVAGAKHEIDDPASL